MPVAARNLRPPASTRPVAALPRVMSRADAETLMTVAGSERPALDAVDAVQGRDLHARCRRVAAPCRRAFST